jgi:2-C-methyl-D-erythritol 4-phosphate cytidylyltransferase
MEKKKCTAIVLAGGQGKRMGTSTAKQYLLIREKPVLYYSLAVFEQAELIDDIILVVGKDQEEYCRQEIVEKYHIHKVKAITEGGAERYHSVWAGLRLLEEDLSKQIVFIHDGARPFVTEEILERVYEQALKNRACVVGMPVKDTMKIASESGWVQATPKRKLVWQVQTPQVFAADLIVPAYRELIEREQELLSQGLEITDDAMVVETIGGCPVKLVEGSYQNIKITTPEDLEIAEIFIGKKSEKN